MNLSTRAIRTIQRRAIDKLRRHPALRALWRERSRGEIGEGAASAENVELKDAEIHAVYNLVRTRAERRVLEKLMDLVSA